MVFRWVAGLISVSGVMLTTTVQAQENMRPLARPGTEIVSPVETETARIATSKPPVPRPVGLMQGRQLKAALAAARQDDWNLARHIALTDGPVSADIIEWQRLRAGEGNFAEYRAFLAANGDWPGLELLRRKGEVKIPATADPAQVIAWFADNDPQTGPGALRLAAALKATGDEGRAKVVLIRAWTNLDLGEVEETLFLNAHGDLLAQYHASRLDHMLWQGNREAAARMMPLVNDGWKKLAAARLGLQRKTGGVDALIAAVPDALRNDPGLSYDRMIWQIGQRRRDQAADMILEQSGSPESLGRPEVWANWRRILARQTMRDGDGERAYALASTHRIKVDVEDDESDSNYADLEWLSGYLALTYLKKPELALVHFGHFRAAVFTPISLGRAGYWEGRAFEALGDREAAMAAYRDAAQHQTSFYGLLAAEKAGVAMDPALTGKGGASPPSEALRNNRVFQAAGLFYAAGQSWETGRFLRHLAGSQRGEALVQITDYALSLGDPYLAVRVGKQAAFEGVVAHRAYYPLTPLGPDTLPVPEALALSIARRESEFHAGAVSGAGARGLMQLMPGTAKQMAGKIGLSYSLGKLTSDPQYNVRLGSAYLAHLIEEFGNNIVLVSVGYNAGPHRARTWIGDRGDPRDPGIDVIDWIEHIPFRETRNYVMRVAESLPIYRARLSGDVVPIRLMEELQAR